MFPGERAGLEPAQLSGSGKRKSRRTSYAISGELHAPEKRSRDGLIGHRTSRLPFILFQRQRDLVQFLLACLEGETNGLIEKCRDVGATWVCCAFSVWLWLYWPGVAVGWGSRKEQLVDKLGDPDSIFEKMRMIILGLPREFLPLLRQLEKELSQPTASKSLE